MIIAIPRLCLGRSQHDPSWGTHCPWQPTCTPRSPSKRSRASNSTTTGSQVRATGAQVRNQRGRRGGGMWPKADYRRWACLQEAAGHLWGVDALEKMDVDAHFGAAGHLVTSLSILAPMVKVPLPSRDTGVGHTLCPFERFPIPTLNFHCYTSLWVCAMKLFCKVKASVLCSDLRMCLNPFIK